MEYDILIVDDDKSFRKMCSSILEKHNYRISEAESGMEALSLLGTNSYRLIFLDLNLPKMDGIETIRKIREKDENIPVFLVTGFENTFFNELKYIREDGIEFQLLRKPIEKVELLSVADAILQKSTIRDSMLRLRLFVVGRTSKLETIIDSLHEIFQDEWAERYSLEVIDVLESPDLADRYNIIATPTLCKISPEPEKRIIGDLSTKRMVFRALGI